MEYSQEESRLQEITNEVLCARQVLQSKSKRLHRDVAYSNLAISLGNLYELTGDLDVLKETIEISRTAMALSSTDDPDWAERCMDLASYLVDLFYLTDDGNIIDEAIELNREALALYPIDDPDWEPTRDVYCRALSITLELRYAQTGDMGALEEAIELGREALALLARGSEGWCDACGYLAMTLRRRYFNAGDEQDIRESVLLLRDAISLWPLTEQGRVFASVCADLSSSLGALSELTEDTTMSDEALSLARKVMNLPNETHYDRFSRTDLLCNHLWKHYQLCHNRELLNEMMRYTGGILSMDNAVYHDQSLFLTAMAHLEQDTQYHNVPLSLLYMARLLELPAGDSAWLWTSIIEYFDALAAHHNLELPEVATTAVKLVSSAMRIISLRAGLMLNPRDQLRNIREADVFGMYALTIAVYAGNHAFGLELLEYTRGFMWSQALRTQDPQLMDLPREMAVELSTLLKGLCQKPSISFKSLEIQIDDDHKQRIIAEMRHRKALQVENILKDVRALPGMENFMRGPTKNQLAELSRICPHTVVILAIIGRSVQAFVLRPSSPLEAGAAQEEHLTTVPLSLSSDELKNLFRALPVAKSRGDKSHQTMGNSGISRMMRVHKPISRTKGLEILWTQVVEPILRTLKLSRMPGSQARPRLYWCPTGDLTFLPLHAAGKYQAEIDNAECCADYVVSSYSPTLSALMRAREGADVLSIAKTRMVLVGDTAAAPSTPKSNRLSYLPNVQLELDAIRSIAAMSVGELETYHDSASIAQITDAFNSADMIHLACHGVQDAQDALSSGFCLGNGKLTVSDIMEFGLNRKHFAFLSACETAKGDEGQPDQVVHLAASMLFVGFRSIVATMWEINDADGPCMASWFYEELFSKPTISIEDIPFALDTAVFKLRAQGVGPERWAPFIHMGA